MSDTQPKMVIRTTSKALTTEYDIMFDRPIEGSQEFQEEMYMMRQASEGDLVNLYIDTCGGSGATVSAFQQIKVKSSAHFHAVLQGNAYSAGSAFFLLCDTQEVGDLAEMMIHTSQQSMSGHSDEVQEFGNQTARTARKAMELIYKDFLTQEEIEKCLLGEAMWLDADQIKERLEKREVIRQQQAVDEAKETYTPEVYAAQWVMDIAEDCESFEYDTVEIITKMLEKAKAAVESVEEDYSKVYITEDVTITLDSVEIQELLIMGKRDTSASMFLDDLNYLRYIASNLGIKFAHNISRNTLAERIDDKIAEIRETLVD